MRKNTIIAIIGLLTVISVARADTKVLSGVPAYEAANLGLDDSTPPDAGSQAFARETLVSGTSRPAYGGNPLNGMPRYEWWYGCAPTSGGMMVGYWDGLPGRGQLYDGDASVWGGDGSQGTKSMVASTAHITAGSENGYTYGDWHNSASYPDHESNPDCVADFMKTVDRSTSYSDIAPGLEGYCEWDNPNTAAVNESLEATATLIDTPYWDGTFTYSSLQSEIDANHPVQLGVICHDGTQWWGHSLIAYGYQDDLFQIKVPVGGGPDVDLTVGGFAVMDTFSTGTAGSEWADWDRHLVTPIIDGEGVEWWPFVEFQGASWIYNSGTPGPYDWMVSDAVTLTVVPEPATLGLLAAGLVALWMRKRRVTK